METNLKMPEVLENYYRSKNAHDVDAMAACFAENALVHDESQDINGAVAIREWIARTTEEYRVQVEVKKVVEEGAKIDVTADVSGNFDGSPLEMYYTFTLAEGRIVELNIDA